MEQKLIVAFYVNVEGQSPQNVSETLFNVMRSLEDDKDDNEKYIVIPIKEGDSRVEVLNPVRVSEDEYKVIEERADRMEKHLKMFFDSMNVIRP